MAGTTQLQGACYTVAHATLRLTNARLPLSPLGVIA